MADAAEPDQQATSAAAARPALESPHIEETLIINRVQLHLARLEVLLNPGGADEVRDALSILEGLA